MGGEGGAGFFLGGGGSFFWLLTFLGGTAFLEALMLCSTLYASWACWWVGTKLLKCHAARIQAMATPVLNTDNCCNPNSPPPPPQCVNPDNANDMRDLPKRYPNTPMTSFPTKRESKSSGTNTISSSIRRAEYSLTFMTRSEALTSCSDGLACPAWNAVNNSDTRGNTRHSVRGSITVMRGGNTPNCNTMVMTLMTEKKTPTHPARCVSSGMASPSAATKHTFNTVANPWLARISQNSAFNTGTRANNWVALSRRDGWDSVGATTTPFFLEGGGFFACFLLLTTGRVGVNPCWRATPYASCVPTKLPSNMSPVPNKAPAKPMRSTRGATAMPATALARLVKPAIGPNHRALWCGVKTDAMNDQY